VIKLARVRKERKLLRDDPRAAARAPHSHGWRRSNSTVPVSVSSPIDM
jgi:hypothetical protein